MKKITFVIMVSLLVGLTSCDKEIEAPQNVKKALAKKFPTATNIEWGKENTLEWEAEFTKDGKEHSANFQKDGTWIETEFDINLSDVPNNIIDVFNMEFDGYEIEEIELSETIKGIVYEFTIEKDEENFEVAIDASGNIISKEQKDDDD